jgi:protein phosphatase PTC2/3
MPDHVFFAVFDGHGGAGAAEYAEAHMVEVLENSLEWKVYRQDPGRDPQLLGEALVVAFVELDAQLKNHQKSLQASGGAPDSSGCTAVTCVVTPQCYVCANIGDSRCVLGTADQTVPLSVDHKPSDEEEEKRVLNAGGKVCW